MAGLASEFFWAVNGDILRLISSAARSHSQLAAENLFLRKELAFYVERQLKPRRADDATRIVALSSLIEWRRILTILKPDTLIGGIERAVCAAVLAPEVETSRANYGCQATCAS